MFHNNRPRYWVSWYDRWHLLIVLILLLLVCSLGYLTMTARPPEPTLAIADPSALLQAGRPVELKGTALAGSTVRIFEGDKLLGETRADSNGNYKFALVNATAGTHTLKAVIESNGVRVESRALGMNIAAVVAVQPTSAPTLAPTQTAVPTSAPTATAIPPTATPTTVPTSAPTATKIPPSATPAPPTATPFPAAGTVQRRGKDNAEMVYVPAGEFSTGGDSSDNPKRTVYLDAFWMDKTEVTNEQFQQFADAAGYKTVAEKQGSGYEFSGSSWDLVNGIFWRAPRGAGSSIASQMKLPVALVSWGDADAYCKWAGKRLATEAEWEKTTRGTDGRKFPWGDSWDGTRLNFCDANCPYNYKDASVNDGFAETAPAGSFARGASPYGALDMAGNVWEWVSDWYDKDYAKTAPTRNPSGPATGQTKVLRGGAWSIDQSYASNGNRFNAIPDFRQRSVGLRCAQ